MTIGRMGSVLTVVLAVGLAGSAGATELKTSQDKTSYAIGMNMAHSLKNNNIDVNSDLLVQAINDVLADKTTLLTDEEAKATLLEFQKEMQAKRMEEMKGISEKNQKEGAAFLAENKTKEGVKTLPSGLQYKVLAEGTGASPKATDTVTVQYKGSLIDGTEFDSSYKRGQAATFPVTGLIKGWTEALQLMKEGAKWQLYIPAELAYGETGAGSIGPNATLIFEVELLGIE